MDTSSQMNDLLRRLRLGGIIPLLPERLRYAQQSKLSHEEFLETILSDEWERRRNNLLSKKIRRAGVDDGVKVFDWKTTSRYDRPLVKKLMSLDFLQNHHNVLIFGSVGVGKTFLAKHLTFLALKTGVEATFVRADKMLKHLLGSMADGTHDKALRVFVKPPLLVIDDFATHALTPQEGTDFYEIVLERYEKKSIIVTSARHVDEWQPLFPDPILANSILDRLSHSSYQVLMEGESIRKQERPK
jgi:DNA replication protein DnaC